MSNMKVVYLLCTLWQFFLNFNMFTNSTMLQYLSSLHTPATKLTELLIHEHVKEHCYHVRLN